VKSGRITNGSTLSRAFLGLRLALEVVVANPNNQKMSRASKLTLLGTSLFAAGTVVFVHFQQQWEKDVSLQSTH
jgi:hypothetical protein